MASNSLAGRFPAGVNLEGRSRSEETSLFHLRDRDGHEVDAVLERRGQIVGLEVKSYP